jgi:monoamine oxidase
MRSSLPCDREHPAGLTRISATKAGAIREQNYSQTAKVFLLSPTRFWLAAGFSGSVTTDLPIERLPPEPGTEVDARGALGAYPIGPYCATLSQMTEAERVAAAFAQARQIFPELANSFEGGVSHCWGLDPWQHGAFALHTPGQIGFLDTLAKAEGRIHFAGEHASLWTGWMRALSNLRAAWCAKSVHSRSFRTTLIPVTKDTHHNATVLLATFTTR